MNSCKVMNLWIFEEMKMRSGTQDIKYDGTSQMMPDDVRAVGKSEKRS